jgi:hypothetical protein
VHPPPPLLLLLLLPHAGKKNNAEMTIPRSKNPNSFLRVEGA